MPLDTAQPGIAAILASSIPVGQIGTDTGKIPTIPIPVSCMALTMLPPLNFVGTTLSINLATGSLPGLMTAAQFSAVAALGTASTQASTAFDSSGSASAAQAFAIQRANQTGTQTASTISDFSAAALLAVTWSTITGKPTFATVATSGSYVDLTNKPSIPSGQVSSDWNAASGVAQVLNKPTLGTASAQNTSAFATSAQGALASSALQSNQAITLSGDATGSGTTAITATLSSVGTASTYSGVTTDAKGRVTAGTSRSTSSTSRAISTTNNSANGYQASSSRDSLVSGNVSISNTSTISGPSSGTIVLERCATNSATGASWTTVDTFTSTQAVSLAVVLQLTATTAVNLRGYIPAGWFYRYRSVTPTGTVTYSTTTSSEEVLL